MKKIKSFNTFINETYTFVPKPEDFTFKTYDELRKEEMEHNVIVSYNIVRIVRKMPDGSIHDYPCKTYERYKDELTRTDGEIINIYPSKHSYDRNKYI